jgi:Flp pilus assembly protein protease CpaA
VDADFVVQLRLATLMTVLGFAVIDDCRRFRISNSIIVAGVGAAYLIAMIDCIVSGNVNVGIDMLAGGGLSFFLAFAVYALRGIGAGDVKLFMLCGMLIGCKYVAAMLIESFAAGIAVGVIEVIAGMGKQKKIGNAKLHGVHFSIGILIGNVCTLVGFR